MTNIEQSKMKEKVTDRNFCGRTRREFLHTLGGGSPLWP